MSGSGYQQGGEPAWWWKVAMHLDQAQLALANAMAHNVDDPRLAHALYHRLREGQAILLDIFRAKGLLPGPVTGSVEAPPPNIPSSEMPAPQAPQAPYAPQASMAVVLPFPSSAAGEAVAVAATEVEQSSPAAAEGPVVLEADQASVASVASGPEEPASPPVEVVDSASTTAAMDPETIASDAQNKAPPADSGAGG